MRDDQSGGPALSGEGRPGHPMTDVGANGQENLNSEPSLPAGTDNSKSPWSFPEDESTSDLENKLDVAHSLVDAGVPLFVAKAAWTRGARDWSGGVGGSGYWIPSGWQHVQPDHGEVDRWRHGDALGMITGCGLDVIDIDPRNGGDSTFAMLRKAGLVPRILARADTPSGGSHVFVRTLGVRKIAIDGVDVQAGDRAGAGRGFVWIAPTRRPAKAGPLTGQVVAYRWVVEPAEADLGTLGDDEPDDGADGLRELIASRRPHARSQDADVDVDAPCHVYAEGSRPWRTLVDRYLARRVETLREAYGDYATWPVGRRTTSGFGWERLVANAAFELGGLAKASWTPWSLEDAHRVFEDVVPRVMRCDRGVGPKWAAQCLRATPAPLPAHLSTGVVS